MTVAEYCNGSAVGAHVRNVPGIRKFGDMTLKRGLIRAQDLFDRVHQARTADRRAGAPTICSTSAGCPKGRAQVRRSRSWWLQEDSSTCLPTQHGNCGNPGITAHRAAGHCDPLR